MKCRCWGNEWCLSFVLLRKLRFLSTANLILRVSYFNEKQLIALKGRCPYVCFLDCSACARTPKMKQQRLGFSRP